MISFISRAKPLAVATECLLKAEASGFLIYNTFQRTLYTKNSLSDCTYKQKRSNVNVKNFHESGNIPKNFGKVIELGDDFSDFEEGSKQKKKQKLRNVNRNYVYSSDSREAAVEEKEKEEDYEFRSRMKQSDDRHSYKSMDRNTHLLSSLMIKLRSKKRREKNKEMVLEGKRIIHDAIKAGLTPLKIFFSRASDLADLKLPEGVETYRIPYRSCKLWCDVVTPQGILGIFPMPDSDSVEIKSDSLPLTVICDNVTDPGNLGSIVRVVASAGCEKLILTPGCVGVWEPKVLRAGAGAHFHFQTLKNCIWADIEKLISDTSRVFVADGNIMSENESVEGNSSTFKKISEISKHLPLTSYSSVEFEKKSTVIIIGGETDGVSDEAYEFARKRNGTRIFIPLKNKVESLNNSVALAVLVFEYQRQFNSIAQKESQQPAAGNAACGIESS